MTEKMGRSRDAGPSWARYFDRAGRADRQFVVSAFRNFNDRDWESFVQAAVYDESGAQVIYSKFPLFRDGSLAHNVAEFVSAIDLESRENYRKGLDLVFYNQFSRTNWGDVDRCRIKELLTFVRLVAVAPPMDLLRKIVLAESVDADVRKWSALVLADFSEKDAFAFWEMLANKPDPVLLPVCLLFYSVSRKPAEVFRILRGMEVHGAEESAVRLSVEAALRQYICADREGLAEVSGVIMDLRPKCLDIVGDILRSDRFAELRARLVGSGVKLPRVGEARSKVSTPVTDIQTQPIPPLEIDRRVAGGRDKVRIKKLVEAMRRGRQAKRIAMKRKPSTEAARPKPLGRVKRGKGRGDAGKVSPTIRQRGAVNNPRTAREPQLTVKLAKIKPSKGSAMPAMKKAKRKPSARKP